MDCAEEPQLGIGCVVVWGGGQSRSHTFLKNCVIKKKNFKIFEGNVVYCCQIHVFHSDLRSD